MIFFRRFHFDTKWFLSSLIFVCGLGAYVNLLEPQTPISVAGLLLIIAGIMFCFCMFLTKSIKRAILYAAGVIIYLTLRFIGLREWYFPLLLSVTVLSTDAYFTHKDRERLV
jgi:hypothetical protein